MNTHDKNRRRKKNVLEFTCQHYFFCIQDDVTMRVEEKTESDDKPTDKTYPWRRTKTDTQVYTLIHLHSNLYYIIQIVHNTLHYSLLGTERRY